MIVKRIFKFTSFFWVSLSKLYFSKMYNIHLTKVSEGNKRETEREKDGAEGMFKR